MNTNLFELSDAIKTVQQKFDEYKSDSGDKNKSSAITLEAFQDTLDSFKLPFNEKLDNLANWQDSNQSKIDWIDKKQKQLKELKSHYSKQNEWIDDYMTQAMDKAGYKQLQTDNHILKIRNYRKKTVIDDEALLPKEFWKEKTTVSIDKKSLYDALKAGKVKGAHLEDNRKTTIN